MRVPQRSYSARQNLRNSRRVAARFHASERRRSRVSAPGCCAQQIAQPHDQRLRGCRPNDDPVPVVRPYRRIPGLGHGREIRQQRGALLGGDRDGTHLAGAKVRQQDRNVEKRHLDLAAEQSLTAGAAPLYGT
jgi:hypothetical protein